MIDPEPSEGDKGDMARVTIETPLGSSELLALCRDVERMLRINSLLDFETLACEEGGVWRLKALNMSNGKQVETCFSADVDPAGLKVQYDSGIKNATTFHVEPVAGGKGANLVVTDDYSETPLRERRQRMDEVDRSLVRWGSDLNRYFRHWAKWSWLWPWRWFMEGPWQNMKPSARRVSYLVAMITLAEFVMFLMVFAVFWLELDGFLAL